ncbi:proline-rich protein 18 [Scyliorhinus canicula]|uniref:proline-rich protein 18 n=1 Tax=Scyliorhinus canicula TaxID=7830 RepID=UPI0018F30460|nr:proline-rich protein 18 [Scyliorhinus canicula]
MRTGGPARIPKPAVPFPPIRPATDCSGRGLRSGQASGPAPQPGPPGRSPAAPRSRFSNAWPEAKLPFGGWRPQAGGPRPLGGSSDSGPASTSGDSARTSTVEMRFSLSLTPEAVGVIQRRSLERLLLGKERGKAPVRSRRPARSLQPPQCRSASAADIRSLVKISLLNDQHKYDDVEYEEEEEGAADPALLRRCMDWLQGVEAARLPRLAS